MDIKRLLTRGGKPYAAEIIDGTETYKVFLEALGNTVILPELIASGWKLTALPLSLSKNGTALEDYPRMEYSPSTAEEMDMYDLMGTEMTMDERRSLLSKEGVKGVDMAEGNYTIQTREDFLDYLERSVDAKLAEDFLPINYFVHPTARFTYEEYLDNKNAQWVSLLERRRVLTLPQFQNLRAWALRNGLKPDFTAQDLISFYFQWGIDGLTTQVLSKRTVERFIRMDVRPGGPEFDRATTVRDWGLIDRNQQEYRKPGTERYTICDPSSVSWQLQPLGENEVIPYEIQKRVGELVEEWETLDGSISFSSRYVIIGDKRFTPLRVKGAYGPIQAAHWNPAQEDAMNTDMFLRSLANEFVEKRKVHANVSSYRALCESGCSPYAALTYIVSSLQAEKTPDPLATDKEEERWITLGDIRAFLREEQVSDYIRDTLTDIMDGATNIDATDKGIVLDSNQTSDKVYQRLYCAHHVLGIPVNDIYKKINEFKVGDADLSFTHGDAVLYIKSEPIDNALKGYQADLETYRFAQLDTADEYLWVNTVARELGPETATRHVGVRLYKASHTTKFDNIITSLQSTYLHCVEEEAPELLSQCEKVQRGAAINAFFSGAMRGFYNMPGINKVVKVTDEERALWRPLITGPYVEDTVTLSDDIIYPGMIGEWHQYCVNAIITPTKVTPRYGFCIRETSLASVWNDFSTTPIYKDLVLRNLVRPGELCWSATALSNPLYFESDEKKAAGGLAAYYVRSQEALHSYDRSLKFTGVPHILETQCPMLAEPVEEVPAAPDEAYKFQAGKGVVLEYEESTVEEKHTHTPINIFTSLSPEDFFYTGGRFTFPGRMNKKPIYVLSPYSLYVDGKELRPADVENLNPEEYPVTHLCGRRYLICDVKGAYWTVEV